MLPVVFVVFIVRGGFTAFSILSWFSVVFSVCVRLRWFSVLWWLGLVFGGFGWLSMFH